MKAVLDAVSYRRSAVRSKGERPPTRGAVKPQEMTEMQYLVSVIDDNANIATPNEMADITAFNGRLKAEGHWAFAAGLASPSTATVIDNRGGGEPLITDGPFVETKEYVAGLWILEASDLDEALKLAAEGSKHCNRKVEVRPLLGD